MTTKTVPTPSARPSAAPPAEEARPTKLGRYRLCFEIASGGMATVYLAHVEGPAGFGKLVALKQIHPHLAKEAGFIEMFMDEARLASRIQHPNVCSVIDFGQDGDSYYLTMEYLVGETLHRVMKAAGKYEGPLPKTPFIRFAVRVIADAAEGLHAAHELDGPAGEPLEVVHRDVSPANLFVTYDGAVRVVDFGIARATDRVHQTATGQVKGNFSYMAPEQMSGQAVDRRADIWSLGVILYELLAGTRLFRRPTLPESIRAVTVEPIPKLAEQVPSLDPELVAIVEHALDRNVDKRYATAREMADALNAYLAKGNRTVSMPQIAEWMHALIPEGLAEKQQLMRLAEQAGAPVPLVHRGQDEQSHSTVKAAHVPLSALEPEKPRSTILIAAAIATLGVTGAIYALLATSEPAEPSAATAPGAASGSQASAAGQSDEEMPPAVSETDETTAAAADPGGVEPVEPALDGDPAATDAVDTGTTPRAGKQARKRKPASAPTRAAPAGTGHVSVATPGGWAEVYHEGQKLGTTPGRFTLPAGHRVLKLRPFGEGKPIRVEVEVLADQTARVSRKL